jgi:hypothetical protein
MRSGKMRIERKRPLYDSDAEECRARGFQPGDRLIGNEGYGPTEIVITVIGEKKILAKTVAQNGNPLKRPENIWTLSGRDLERAPA